MNRLTEDQLYNRRIKRHYFTWSVRGGVHTCAVEIVGRSGVYRARMHFRPDGVWEILLEVPRERGPLRFRGMLKYWEGRSITAQDDVYAKSEAGACLLDTMRSGHVPTSFEYVQATENSAFRPHLVSDAKRATRARLYQEVAAELDGETPTSVLILPGEIPAGEIGCARHFLDPCHITAFDRQEKPLVRAKEAGADEVIMGDFDNVTRWRVHESLRNRNFNFVNLDLCCTLSGGWASSLIHRAGCIADLLAVFVSYGHEKSYEVENFVRRGEWVLKEYKAGRIPPHCVFEGLMSLPINIFGRIVYMFDSLRRPCNVHSVYLYKGNSVPMLGVLFYNRTCHRNKAEIHRFRNSDLRPLALAYADAHGTTAAASAYAIAPNVITAWKAVRTRARVVA